MSIRVIIIGLAALLIVTAVGGAIYAAKSYVEGLNNKLNEQQEQIAGLVIDKKLLEVSNKSLVMERTRKAEETRDAFEEIARLREVDARSQRRLNEIEQLLRSTQSARRLDELRNSEKANELLDIINLNIKCYIDHFDEIDGQCIKGEWVDLKGGFLPIEDQLGVRIPRSVPEEIRIK